MRQLADAELVAAPQHDQHTRRAKSAKPIRLVTVRRVPAFTQSLSNGSSRYLKCSFSGAEKLRAVKRKSNVLLPGGTEVCPFRPIVNLLAHASSSTTGGGRRLPAAGSIATTPRRVGNHIRPSRVIQPPGLPPLDSVLLMPSAAPYDTGERKEIFPSAKSFSSFRLSRNTL